MNAKDLKYAAAQWPESIAQAQQVVEVQKLTGEVEGDLREPTWLRSLPRSEEFQDTHVGQPTPSHPVSVGQCTMEKKG